MKRIVSLILALTLMLCATLSLSSCEKTGKDENLPDMAALMPSLEDAPREITYVEIKVKNYGKIICALDPLYAPETVANFLSLVDSGFYNGLTFHRMQVGFVLQGGCPNGNGTGSTTPIKGEFAVNGVRNDMPHLRGVLSMARRGDSYDSGSCQFFICHDDARRSLDGSYAAFGYVVEGIWVVDEIAGYVLENRYDAMKDGMGSLYTDYQPVIESITRLEGYTPKK